MSMPSFNTDSKFLPKIGEQPPANRQAVIMKPAVLHGVSNETIMVDVRETILGAANIKLNRLTILAYTAIVAHDDGRDCEVYKLWTSGGFVFYADTDAFKGVKREENKGVEAGESRPSDLSN